MTKAARVLFMSQSLGECKKEAWRVFSEWIRRRNADWRGYVNCCSCGVLKNWKQGDAGHWPNIAGRRNSVLFDERGCHFQCKQCNLFKGGNPVGYDAFMRRRYGEKIMRELEKLNTETVRYEKEDYAKMIDGWVKKLKELEK